MHTVRTECLDCLLILGPGQLARVLRSYLGHYNEQRPHRGIHLSVPARTTPDADPPFQARRHDVIGGLIHEYHPVAAYSGSLPLASCVLEPPGFGCGKPAHIVGMATGVECARTWLERANPELHTHRGPRGMRCSRKIEAV